MRCIFIGDHFYYKSGTMMSPIYEEDGTRADWGKVQLALRDGEEVFIRPATKAELAVYEKQLAEWIPNKGIV